MALSTGLEQTLTIQTRLTPEQIQVIKMIELPNIELEERIQQELIENPILELGADEPDDKDIREDNDYSQDNDLDDVYGAPEDRELDSKDYGEERGEDPLKNADFDYNTYVSDDDPDDIPDYRLKTNNYSPDDDYETVPIVQGQDFQSYLIEQIGQQNQLTDMERAIAEYVIGNLNEKGYLARRPEQMVDDLAFAGVAEVTDEEMQRIVDIVRKLDPIGVGAYDLQDCLLLQLRCRPASPAVNLAISLIEKNMEEVARHHFERLQKRYNLDEEDFKAAMLEITSCNPNPSSAYSGDVYETRRNQITPDFRVEVIDGEIYVSLTDDNVSPVHVSRDYQDMLKRLQQGKPSKADKEASRYIKDKIESARSFIDAIRQRNETLLNTMKAIADFQREYFIMGDDCYLRPMILEDIAKLTGSDPSTISRVSNSKYVQTDFGIISLKHFFSESLTNVDGEEVSTKEIKKVLRTLVDQEDKRHPYTDEQLVRLLGEQGYRIARRTVAKYRDQLGIPVTGQRKKLTTN